MKCLPSLVMILASVLAGCSQDIPKTGTAHFETWCNNLKAKDTDNPFRCECGTKYLSQQTLTEQQERVFYDFLQKSDTYLERDTFPSIAVDLNMELETLKAEVMVIMQHFAIMERECNNAR